MLDEDIFSQLEQTERDCATVSLTQMIEWHQRGYVSDCCLLEFHYVLHFREVDKRNALFIDPEFYKYTWEFLGISASSFHRCIAEFCERGQYYPFKHGFLFSRVPIKSWAKKNNSPTVSSQRESR